MNIFVAETKILLHPMSMTVQIGNNVAFDCVGQDNAAGPVVYQWSLFGGSNLQTIDRVNVGVSNFTSLIITNVQFTTHDRYTGVRCVFGTENSGSALMISDHANITLIGW